MPRRYTRKNNQNKRRGRHPIKHSDASLEKWNTISDIPLDEEDQFHASRDKILLEGEDVEDDFEDDDEVFAFKEVDYNTEDEDGDWADNAGKFDLVELGDSKLASNKQKSRNKATKQEAYSSEESGKEESWGRSKSAYYSSNAAQIESDDEEAQEMEEKEATRLQAKARDEMEEEDFGLYDPHDLDMRDTIDHQILLQNLEEYNSDIPQFLDDWEDAARQLMGIRAKLEKLHSTEPDAPIHGMIDMHYQTLLTYSATLSSYMYLRASKKYAERPERLKSHPILARLLSLQQTLSSLKNFGFTEFDSRELDVVEVGEDVEMNSGEAAMDEIISTSVQEHQEPELQQSDSVSHLDATIECNNLEPSKRPPKKRRKTVDGIAEPCVPVFDLIEPEFTPVMRTRNSRPYSNAPDIFGDALTLQYADGADKKARRKSLHFHTAKIEGSSARRQGARHALTGDVDLPYRQRKKEKGVISPKDAKQRVKVQGDADLDAEEWVKQDAGDGADENEMDLDGYYDLVKRTSGERKAKKKAEHETAQAALRPKIEDFEANGPRSLTRAILTNKGLTPRRPKASRNPRVKKRKMFEKAKKKVASQKAIYKGGIAETGGRYDGERTGISKVVKSTPLG
ncbi:hypothetical protein AMATHDRAFT_72960 [Amanita thiersii Skay4041]|uniref:Sas10 C-terminal domain-containing protein n=1 Tax=Amanita thiersii Skay4041 TaxID=703135 RepID=A0A2A9NZE6_9AGAR|nr:hypothetical protein AMATHDRAFT_72960 [Amanita thiersii Skay4041]